MHECPGDLLTSFSSSRQAPFCLQDSKLFSVLGTRWVGGVSGIHSQVYVWGISDVLWLFGLDKTFI